MVIQRCNSCENVSSTSAISKTAKGIQHIANALYAMKMVFTTFKDAFDTLAVMIVESET